MLTIKTLDQSVKYVQTWISVSIVNFEHVIVGCNYLLQIILSVKEIVSFSFAFVKLAANWI